MKTQTKKVQISKREAFIQYVGLSLFASAIVVIIIKAIATC